MKKFFASAVVFFFVLTSMFGQIKKQKTPANVVDSMNYVFDVNTVVLTDTFSGKAEPYLIENTIIVQSDKKITIVFADGSKQVFHLTSVNRTHMDVESGFFIKEYRTTGTELVQHLFINSELKGISFVFQNGDMFVYLWAQPEKTNKL